MRMPKIPHFKPLEAKVDGQRLTVVISGADRLATLLDMIENAQSSLRMFFYIFADDKVGARVRDALVDALARDVKVWLLIDGFGCAEHSDSFFVPLIEAGAVFSRFYPRWGRSYLLRNHQKIVVADEDVAIIGGSNVVENYFTDDPGGASWHDMLLLVQGPIVVRLARYFDALRRWMLSERPRLRGLLHILSRRSDKTGRMRWLFNGPFRRISPLTRSIRHDISAAQRVDLIQAYFSPNWGMLRRLARVERRGGALRLITAARSDNTTTISAARHCYRRLLRNNTEIYEYQPQMLHMKLIVADDIVYIGSANFDMRSLYINGEIMMRVDDPGFAKKMRGLVAAHIPHCDPITRESHKSRSTWNSRLHWLLAYFIVSTVDFSVTRTIGLRRG